MEIRQAVDKLLYYAANAYTTSHYDRFQYYTNGIRKWILCISRQIIIFVWVEGPFHFAVHQKGLEDLRRFLLFFDQEDAHWDVVALEPSFKQFEGLVCLDWPVGDIVILDWPLEEVEEELELVGGLGSKFLKAVDPPFGVVEEVVLPRLGVQLQFGF